MAISFAEDVVGSFQEKSCGKYFSYRDGDPTDTAFPSEFCHRIFVADGVWRYGKVLKTVAYIIVDEDESGPVVEKWDIRKIKE